MKIFGNPGFCGKCRKKKKKMHCRVRGVLHCQGCYSAYRYKDPKKRKRQLEACRRYRLKMKHGRLLHHLR